MKIGVLGMDPSLRHWGLAVGVLDLDTGELELSDIHTIEPKEEKSKQVRKNSKDLEIAQILSVALKNRMYAARVVFVEVPHGSQSARAMASYGICVGILGTYMAHDIQLIEVTATESKKIFVGDKNASKETMIQKALQLYPDANWPMHRGQLAGKAEHIADAIAAIHAGVKTPLFQNLRRIYQENKQTP